MARKSRRDKPRTKATADEVRTVRREAAKAKFLAAYAQTGRVAKSCAVAGVCPSAHHGWLKVDEEYAAAFVEAREFYIETLEAEVDRRAFRGVKKKRWFRDVELETYREYSDLLAMFRLKALRPEVYRERTEVKSDAEVKVTIQEDPNWYGNADRIETPEGPPPPA